MWDAVGLKSRLEATAVAAKSTFVDWAALQRRQCSLSNLPSANCQLITDNR